MEYLPFGHLLFIHYFSFIHRLLQHLLARPRTFIIALILDYAVSCVHNSIESEDSRAKNE
jgi:hypothetical protein